MKQKRSLAIRQPAPPARLTQTAKHAASNQAQRPVPHWGVQEVRDLVAAAEQRGRGFKGRRDALLIQTLFDATPRVSEALGLTPSDIVRTPGGYRLRVVGKTGYREAACSVSLADRLGFYAYQADLPRGDRFFPITKHRAWQIVDAAVRLAGLEKPPGVGTVHILRHSGAIERMRLSGNPRSVQDQLGHASPAMTMRYWRTLAAEEALQIQEAVEFAC